MNQSSPTRSGITHIEILAAVVVTALLLTLLLPALQASRAVARRDQSKNNLKMLGIAMHNYHDTFRTFPPGWVSPTPYPQEKAGFGWQAMILPFIEQGPLYDSMQFDVPVGQDAFVAEKGDPTMVAIKVYRNPDDTTPAFNRLRGGMATSNYSGNHGSLPLPRWAPIGTDHFWPGTTITPVASNGLFCWNSRIGIRDIHDGTSNTFMIGERSSTSGAGIWAGVRSNNHETDQVTTCSPGNEINSGLNAYSGNYPGGAQFVFCDGAVRFVSEKIDSHAETDGKAGTFQLLSSRADGQPVGGF